MLLTENGSKKMAAPDAVSLNAGMSEQAIGSSAAIASISAMLEPADIDGKMSASAYLNNASSVLLGSHPRR